MYGVYFAALFMGIMLSLTIFYKHDSTVHDGQEVRYDAFEGRAEYSNIFASNLLRFHIAAVKYAYENQAFSGSIPKDNSGLGAFLPSGLEVRDEWSSSVDGSGKVITISGDVNAGKSIIPMEVASRLWRLSHIDKYGLVLSGKIINPSGKLYDSQGVADDQIVLISQAY